MCYTVVHGDHRVVLPMKCSYCISGQLEQAALSTHARPEGELAAMIEKKGQREALRDEVEDGTVANIAREEPLGVKDVANADWSEFDLDPELWQYV